MDTFRELRQLAEDLDSLGDMATSSLVRRAAEHFMAWKFPAGERLLARALERRRWHEAAPEQREVSRYFETCALVV